MRTSLRRMLAIHEGIILLAILVAMRDDHLNVVALEMNDRVLGVGRHILVQQIDQAIPRIKLSTII